MERRARFNLAYLAFALLTVLLVQQWWGEAQRAEPVPYSEFEQALAAGRVSEVVITDTEVVGTLKHPDEHGRTEIVATRVEPDLAQRLSGYGVPYRRAIGSTWLRDLLSWKETKEPYGWAEKMGWHVISHARDNGVIIRPLGNVIVIMPPLTIGEQNLNQLLKVIRDAIVAATEG